MSTYLFIHGSWHGAWCWYKIIPELEKAGHRALAIDLPSLGSDKTPVAEITPYTWADYVCELLEKEEEPVILVGHSRGGIILSQVAERMPDKIKVLVYMAAFMVPNGESLVSTANLPVNSDSLISSSMKIDGEAGYATLDKGAIESAFYHLCPPEDVVLARLLTQPEALAPLVAQVNISNEKYGQVPRVYIEALQDRAITLPLQRFFLEQLPCDKVMSIDSDHSPFFSRPKEVVKALLELH